MKQIDEEKLKDWQAYYEEFNNESPRGMVIIASAQLEALLQKIIETYLSVHLSDIRYIFSSHLTSFDGKINLARSLKIIDKTIYYDLNIIRQIRNEFAHSLYYLSFDSDTIVKLCQKFKHKIPFDHFPNTPINQFAVASSMVLTRLNLVLQAI